VHSKLADDPEFLLQAVFHKLAHIHSRSEKKGRHGEAVQAIRDRQKILSWLFPDPAASLEDGKFLLFLKDCGFSVQKIEELRVDAQKRHRGRPVSGRNAALVALRIRFRHPEKSFREIAQQVCRCGHSSHGQSCARNLMREARLIKAFLRKHGYHI